jgi:hypothetical protein
MRLLLGRLGTFPTVLVVGWVILVFAGMAPVAATPSMGWIPRQVPITWQLTQPR